MASNASSGRVGGRRSREWVLVTLHSARIAEQIEDGSTWDPNVGAAAAERQRDNGQAVGALIGIVNPAAGIAFAALSSLSASSPSGQADPTHPDPVLQVSWTEGDADRRTTSARMNDIVRPVFDYPFLVRVSELQGSGVSVMAFDDDGEELNRPLIGEVVIPRAALRGVLSSGEDAEIELSNAELRALVVRIRPVQRGQILHSQSAVVELRNGLGSVANLAPAGALVSVTASGGGRIGGGTACPPDVGIWGVPNGGCGGYNLRIGTLPSAPHGSAVVITGRPPTLSGFSIADYGDEMGCAAFIKPSTGTVVVGVNDNDYGNNSGSFTFDVAYSVPPDGSDALEWGPIWGCDPDEGY